MNSVKSEQKQTEKGRDQDGGRKCIEATVQCDCLRAAHAKKEKKNKKKNNP